jgi:hypothetical protein
MPCPHVHDRRHWAFDFASPSKTGWGDAMMFALFWGMMIGLLLPFSVEKSLL